MAYQSWHRVLLQSGMNIHWIKSKHYASVVIIWCGLMYSVVLLWLDAWFNTYAQLIIVVLSMLSHKESIINNLKKWVSTAIRKTRCSSPTRNWRRSGRVKKLIKSSPSPSCLTTAAVYRWVHSKMPCVLLMGMYLRCSTLYPSLRNSRRIPLRANLWNQMISSRCIGQRTRRVSIRTPSATRSSLTTRILYASKHQDMCTRTIPFFNLTRRQKTTLIWWVMCLSPTATSSLYKTPRTQRDAQWRSSISFRRTYSLRSRIINQAYSKQWLSPKLWMKSTSKRKQTNNKRRNSLKSRRKSNLTRKLEKMSKVSSNGLSKITYTNTTVSPTTTRPVSPAPVLHLIKPVKLPTEISKLKRSVTKSMLK
jgi:hypothetical protein